MMPFEKSYWCSQMPEEFKSHRNNYDWQDNRQSTIQFLYLYPVQYLRDRKNAFYYAFRGFYASLKKETHMRLHLLAAIAVIAAGFYVGLAAWEWLMICACIALVMICELFNTAIEQLCNLVTAEVHPAVRYIKDISAAAVLLASLLALTCGIVVFGRHFGLFT